MLLDTGWCLLVCAGARLGMFVEMEPTAGQRRVGWCGRKERWRGGEEERRWEGLHIQGEGRGGPGLGACAPHPCRVKANGAGVWLGWEGNVTLPIMVKVIGLKASLGRWARHLLGHILMTYRQIPTKAIPFNSFWAELPYDTSHAMV